MSIPRKRNQIIGDRQKFASSPGVGLLYNNKIHDLDLPDGLIELLVENNFTLKSLVNIGSSELSKTLGIDEEVATLICNAAKNKKKKINI
jgi:hypothetical protein